MTQWCFVLDPVFLIPGDNFLTVLAPFWILVDDFLTYLWQGSGILFNILKRGQGRAQRGRRPDHSVDALRSRRSYWLILAAVGSSWLLLAPIAS